MELEPILEEFYTILRELQLHHNLFSKIFSSVLYMTKIICLAASVFGGFSAIRLAHSNPPLSGLYALIAIDTSIFFISIFQPIHGLAEALKELKEVMEVKSATLSSKKGRTLSRMTIRSVPNAAMDCGGFGQVERESVLNYLSFVSQQIVSLLLAF